MLKHWFSVILFGALTACSMQPLSEAGTLSDTRSPEQLYPLILQQAQKCWSREAGFTADGITVESHINSSYGMPIAEISATRGNVDLGRQEPFVRVSLKQSNTGSRIDLYEGSYACSITGDCAPKGYVNDVKQWISGQTNCVPRS